MGAFRVLVRFSLHFRHYSGVIFTFPFAIKTIGVLFQNERNGHLRGLHLIFV